jgi:hypothetical protein
MNRKKIIYSLAMLALAALAVFNASINTRKNGMSDISPRFDTHEAAFSSLPSGYGAYTSVIRGREGVIMLGSFRDGRYMYHKPPENKTAFFGDYRVHDRYGKLDNFTKSLVYIGSLTREVMAYRMCHWIMLKHWLMNCRK